MPDLRGRSIKRQLGHYAEVITRQVRGHQQHPEQNWDGACYDTTLIFLEHEIVAMGRRSMKVDVALMR
jgi:hypothetical protein